jgi:phenylalanyl-tRNA synthetase alpha subunit
MSIIAIDTYEVVQELKAAGFTEVQAEAVTRAVRKAQDVDLSNLATKSDIATLATKSELLAFKSELSAFKSEVTAVKSDLQLQIAETKADIERNLGNNKVEMLKWTVGAIGVQTVVILGASVALIRALAH